MTPPPEEQPDEIEQVIRKVSIYGANSADLDVLCPPNRWDAFTTNELHEIRAGLDMLWQEHRKSPDAQRVWDEITAEYERRRRDGT